MSFRKLLSNLRKCLMSKHIMLKIRSRASMFVTIFALPFNMQTVQTTGIEVFDVNMCASY